MKIHVIKTIIQTALQDYLRSPPDLRGKTAAEELLRSLDTYQTREQIIALIYAINQCELTSLKKTITDGLNKRSLWTDYREPLNTRELFCARYLETFLEYYEKFKFLKSYDIKALSPHHLGSFLKFCVTREIETLGNRIKEQLNTIPAIPLDQKASSVPDQKSPNNVDTQDVDCSDLYAEGFSNYFSKDHSELCAFKSEYLCDPKNIDHALMVLRMFPGSLYNSHIVHFIYGGDYSEHDLMVQRIQEQAAEINMLKAQRRNANTQVVQDISAPVSPAASGPTDHKRTPSSSKEIADAATSMGTFKLRPILKKKSVTFSAPSDQAVAPNLGQQTNQPR